MRYLPTDPWDDAEAYNWRPNQNLIATPTPRLAVRLGVDFGQKLDPTAILVVEQQLRPPRPDHPLDTPEAGAARPVVSHFVARLIERLPLGTPYPAVVARLLQIDARLRPRGISPDLWVDATGLGQPIVDMLFAAGLPARAVYLTGSDQVQTGEHGELRLGKAPLVSRLQVLLQSERIHLPQSAEATALCEELLNYEIRVNESANAQFGAFKTGAHDDLVTALGLACWEDLPSGVSSITPPVDVIWEAGHGGL